MTEEKYFVDRQQFETFLKNYFEKIANIDDVILFAHQVNDWKWGMNDESPIERTKQILSHGLRAGQYGSADGTLRRMGAANDDVTDQIINYDYHNYKKSSGKNCMPTIILAFPRKVKYKEESIDFAEPKYDHLKDPDYSEKINKLLNNGDFGGFSTDPQFVPKSWLDIIYGFNNYSIRDNLLAFYQDENGCYHCILPNTHWLYEDKDVYEEHKTNLAEKIAEEGGNLDDAIYKKVYEYQRYVDSCLDDYD